MYSNDPQPSSSAVSLRLQSFAASLRPAASVTYDDVLEAERRIRPYVAETPLVASNLEAGNGQLFLKLENRHVTGSFKERGACNFLESLTAEQRALGVVAASAGNHAYAVARHARLRGINSYIVMPDQASTTKVIETQAEGAEVEFYGRTFDQAYQHAQRIARDSGRIFIPAYEDARVVAGQGTIGLEIARQLVDVDSAIIPIGGGGLIAGTALALKHHNPSIHILGVRSNWAQRVQALNPRNTEYHEVPKTLADGIAIKQPGELTLALIAKYVDQQELVTEREIQDALRRLMLKDKIIAEGAGAAALAALRAGLLPSHAKRTAVIISGGNIDTELLTQVLRTDFGT